MPFLPPKQQHQSTALKASHEPVELINALAYWPNGCYWQSRHRKLVTSLKFDVICCTFILAAKGLLFVQKQ